MTIIKKFLFRVTEDQKGVTTVEYAIMVVLVTLAVATFGAGLTTSVTDVYARVVTTLAG